MTKVKTFTIPLKIFHVRQALEELDRDVNDYLANEQAVGVVSVSDTLTTDDSGTTIGMIRSVAYNS